MNKREAIAHLEELKNDFKEYVSIETKEKDVQALEVAIVALKETAQEVPFQEQLININKKVESIQWCVTIFSTAIIIILINALFSWLN